MAHQITKTPDYISSLIFTLGGAFLGTALPILVTSGGWQWFSMFFLLFVISIVTGAVLELLRRQGEDSEVAEQKRKSEREKADLEAVHNRRHKQAAHQLAFILEESTLITFLLAAKLQATSHAKQRNALSSMRELVLECIRHTLGAGPDSAVASSYQILSKKNRIDLSLGKTPETPMRGAHEYSRREWIPSI